MPKDDWVFWLNVTNIALGSVVFLAVSLWRPRWFGRLRAGTRSPATGQSRPGTGRQCCRDGRLVPGLGVTMADGGEPVKPLPEHSGREETQPRVRPWRAHFLKKAAPSTATPLRPAS